MEFQDLSLSQPVQQALSEREFTTLTPIQEQAIPVVLEGKDIIGQAQTGTGKTLAFGLPAVESLDPAVHAAQVLVLTPTRELALQVKEEIAKVLRNNKDIRISAVYGGESIDRQIRELKKGSHIVVGTPGRVIDHLNRGTISFRALRMAVLDEADEMLNMGFREDIEKILNHTPEERQTLFFSATMPEAIIKLTKKYLTEPEFIKTASSELIVPNIEQFYFPVKEKFKAELLSWLFAEYNLEYVLIFCNTKKRVDDLVKSLQQKGVPAEGLHGDMQQNRRTDVMSRFRKRQVRYLACTDVAARGIDVNDVEAVVNYDSPQDLEFYVHRIGRTGRAGKTGMAFTFQSKKDPHSIRGIEKYTKTSITKLDPPRREDIEKAEQEKNLNKIRKILDEGEVSNEQIKLVRTLQEEGYDLEAIAGALLKINPEFSPAGTQNSGAGDSAQSQRLFINAGRSQKVGPRDIIDCLTDQTNMHPKDIGDISIKDNFSFVELPSDQAGKVLSSGRGKIRGKQVNFEPANS